MRDWLIRSDAKRGIWIPWTLELSQEVEADILLAYRIAARTADSEISGIGRVRENQDNTFSISEIVIPNQTCTGGHTEFLGEEMTSLLDRLVQEGKDPSEFNFWWHSHVEGVAWFSSIDDEMIKNRLHAMMTDVNLDLYPDIPEEAISGPLFSLVGNIYGKMTARCDFLHRKGEEYRQYMFVIPVVRHLAALPKEELNRIFADRYRAIDTIVEDKVVFGRSTGLLRKRKFGSLTIFPSLPVSEDDRDGDSDDDDDDR